MTFIVDAHLDLAYGVVSGGRDLMLPVGSIRELEAKLGHPHGVATVSLPALREAGVAVFFGTLYASPSLSWTRPGEAVSGGYSTPEEAEQQALAQLRVYEGWAERGLVRLIASVADLEHHLELWRADLLPGVVVLMEGADPIVEPGQLRKWWDRGVRVVGTSWGRTRYAGGTRFPGGLTDLGRELLAGMKELGVVLDVSHQSWEAFWDSMDVGFHRVMASHSNAFALLGTHNRHLTDDMIKAIGTHNGMIGVVMSNGFLDANWSRINRNVVVSIDKQVRAHLGHIAGLIGWDKVGIGSDLDGGFGSLETPGIDTISDLKKIGDVVPPDVKEAVLGQNWINFLKNALPR